MWVVISARSYNFDHFVTSFPEALLFTQRYPPRFYHSWPGFSGSLVSLLLSRIFPKASVTCFGWKDPFLAGTYSPLRRASHGKWGNYFISPDDVTRHLLGLIRFLPIGDSEINKLIFIRKQKPIHRLCFKPKVSRRTLVVSNLNAPSWIQNASLRSRRRRDTKSEKAT